jgi:hypothetical protein
MRGGLNPSHIIMILLYLPLAGWWFTQALDRSHPLQIVDGILATLAWILVPAQLLFPRWQQQFSRAMAALLVVVVLIFVFAYLQNAWLRSA